MSCPVSREGNKFSHLCGICKKPGAINVWYSDLSPVAHLVCIEKISPIEADLMKKINETFEENHRNQAHIIAIRAITRKLKGLSIKSFLDAYGPEKLRTIFDPTGIDAIISYETFLRKKNNPAIE